MRTRIALLLVLALVSGACETATSSFVDYFKQEHKVDLSDPADVGFKKQFGNEGEKDALGTYQKLRRYQHELTGEGKYGNKDWDAAREQYDKAKDWVTNDDPSQAGQASYYSTISHLNGRTADTWIRQADEEAKAGNPDAKKHFQKSAAVYKNAIDAAEEASIKAQAGGLDATAHEYQKAKYLGRAARAYYGAGNEGQACVYALDALRIDPSHRLALAVKNKLGCT